MLPTIVRQQAIREGMAVSIEYRSPHLALVASGTVQEVKQDGRVVVLLHKISEITGLQEAKVGSPWAVLPSWIKQ